MSITALYKEPAALDTKKHVNLKLKLEGDFAFASHMNSVPVTGTEFFEASRHYPILFVKNDAGEVLSLALLSLKKEGHDLGNEWKNVYVPAVLRRYPFAITKEGGVVFDQQCPMLNEEDGELLFNEEGEPTDTMKRVVDFLRACEQNFAYTEQFLKAVQEADLLTEFKPSVKVGKGTVTLTDFFFIDEKKFLELPAETVQDWFKKGWIGWVYAHLHSIRSLGLLIQRHQAE
ncbi:SapC family protein [Teredinibacter sp. KSP-S5-2]|uniref:SapC family protein n=1 Tax=Teredinibacter sp. KSP-S5-2 TaxID=3034506 RepID=UPI0029351A29|nr:SapC family protein [Teredinibacter sp. KSP-S5-2]WNO08717.1 SapC family protein [Teredinibacter sp. KSP-S5-2]